MQLNTLQNSIQEGTYRRYRATIYGYKVCTTSVMEYCYMQWNIVYQMEYINHSCEVYITFQAALLNVIAYTS